MVKQIPDICTCVSRKTLSQRRTKRQLLQAASFVAADFLIDKNKDDCVPLLKHISCGREGSTSTLWPLSIRLPILREDVQQVAKLLSSAHQEGHSWGDMTIRCWHGSDMYLCAVVLNRRGLPHQVRKKTGQLNPGQVSTKVMILRMSKGLEFPVVAMMGMDLCPSRAKSSARWHGSSMWGLRSG